MSNLLLPARIHSPKCLKIPPCHDSIGLLPRSLPCTNARVRASNTFQPGVAAVPGNRLRSSHGEAATGSKRQPPRHERGKHRQAPGGHAGYSGRQQQQQTQEQTSSDSLLVDEHGALAAVDSCRSEREISNLYAFLKQQCALAPPDLGPLRQPHSPSLHTPPEAFALPETPIQAPQTPPFPQPPVPLPHPNSDTPIPPELAIRLLARLSQLSPAPALLVTPHLDTTAAYAPLTPQASRSESAGYVPPPLPQPTGQLATAERAAEILEEERAEDAASLEAMQQRLLQRQLVDSLLADAIRGLPQLPLSSITGLLSALARSGFRSTSTGAHDPVAQVAAHLQRSNALLLMHRRNPRALANTAWALAKLGHDPGLPWISQFLLASSASLPKLTAVDVSAIAWALARWRFRPAPQWLGAFYTRVKQVAAQLGTQGLCNVSWALAVLRVGPPRDMAEVLMLEAQVQLPFFSATALATLCWSLAATGHKPPNFWLHEVYNHLTRTLPKAPLAARGLPHANTVWALSVWQASPPPALLALLCSSATPHLPRMSAASCAVLLTGLADLGHCPKQAWVSLALEEFHKRHTDADPASLVAVVWAVSRLLQPAGEASSPPPPSWAPPRKWRVRYAHVLQDIAWAQARAFHTLQPAQLVDAAVAFADLSFYPGDEWMDRHEAHCNACVEAFTAYQVRLLSNAMEKLDQVYEGDYLPRDGEVV